MTRTYRSELREQQAAATRERIVEATWELLRTTRPVDLSYADVAKKAGVSKRTVYRHFPTSDDLFMGVSDKLFEALGETGETSLPEAVEGLRRQLEMLEKDPAIFRVFFAVPTKSRSGGTAGLEALLDPLFENMEGVHGQRKRIAMALLDLIASPYLWDVLHANWGMDARQAHRATTFALRAILELAARHPEGLDPEGPPNLDWNDLP